MPTIIATCSQSWPLTYFLAMRFNHCLNNYCYWQEITCNFPPKVHPFKNHIHISYFPQTVGWAKLAFWVGLLRDFTSFPTPNVCFFVSSGCVVANSIFGRGFFKNWLVQWSGLQWLGSFQNNYPQSAPLPVISRATTPLIRVVTAVARSCRPFMYMCYNLRLQLVYWPILFEKCANCER